MGIWIKLNNAPAKTPASKAKASCETIFPQKTVSLLKRMTPGGTSLYATFHRLF